MNYIVRFSETARKDLLNIPSPAQYRVSVLINRLIQNPRPPGCKKLKGLSGMWRARVGDYRILYGVNDNTNAVTIYRVLHRKEAYR